MKVITIGRSEENDVVITDPCASRHHLQIIQHDDGHFSVSDFGSTNGTYVNGQRINGEVILRDNDIIRIGNTTIPWTTYFNPVEQNGTQTFAKPSTETYMPDSPTATSSTTKDRHGFVTFWLWLGIIGSALGTALDILLYQNLTNLGYLGMDLIINGVDITPFTEAIRPHILIWQIVTVIGGVCLIICYSLLLKWKKKGFWGAIVIAIILAIVNVIMTNLVKQDYLLIGLSLNLDPIIQVIATPISLIILWATLQIKKNGVSCWKLLEPTNNDGTSMSSNSGISMKKEHCGQKKTWLWIVLGFIVAVAIIVIILLSQKKHIQTDRPYTDINSVFVSGNDVYAVGSTCEQTSETDVPTLWKNGIAQEIGEMGNFNKATSVFVSGSDVYVTIDNSDKGQALLWKNGESQLLAEGFGSVEANCVYVYGDDVYVAGQKDGQPTLWKNGIPNSLGESGSANSVVVKGDGIYVAGYLGEFFSGEAFLYILRKNGEEVAYNLEMSRANSIFITDNDEIFVAGEANNKPALWKDGGLIPLGYVEHGSAESVAVNNAGLIVVTGIVQNPNSNAMVWVNGEGIQVDDILSYQAMSVVTDGTAFYIGGCAKDGLWSVWKHDGMSDFNRDNLKRVSTAK